MRASWAVKVDLPPPPALRASVPEDEPFLRELYRTTRAGELAALPWGEAEVSAFCRWQFDVQVASYRQSYPQARHLIICDREAPAGRMITARTDEGLVLVDLALLPAFRNRGWGTLLLQGLQEDARRSALPLLLQVERNNRALTLYRRLGFAVTGESGVRFAMRWSPGAADASAAR